MTCNNCGNNEYYVDGTYTQWYNSDLGKDQDELYPLKITERLEPRCGRCDKIWKESK
jgi:hypothetical protein